ncbi:hypothetical protein MAALD49_20780 [Marinobacter shengliensis]|nr:hypothetical protein MAALD49_20780 [Marinobacter shengliensis]
MSSLSGQYNSSYPEMYEGSPDFAESGNDAAEIDNPYYQSAGRLTESGKLPAVTRYRF